MKLLGLDSSGLVASVAVVADDDLLGEYHRKLQKNAFADTFADAA